MDPFIEAEEVAGHSIKRCCELFEVSRAAFYERHSGEPCARTVSDVDLTENIRQIHDESDGTYGSPRVHKELNKRGVACGRRRVALLMRLAGLEGRAKKRWRKTTVADPAFDKAKDLIQREFGPAPSWTGATSVTSPTSRPGRAGRTWPPSSTSPPAGSSAGPWPIMRTELVTDAIEMAFTTRRPPAGAIFHSDRGCQPTSTDYHALATEHGMVLSAGMAGECWDNAVAESFFATIKRELIDTHAWPTRAGLRAAIFDWIEGWYNTRRLHSSLGYLSPAEYEATNRHHADRQAA